MTDIIKSVLAEIGNPTNTITMMVDENKAWYHPLVKTLSDSQLKKLRCFEASCKYGWYSTRGPQAYCIFADPVYNDTRDDTGRFQAGFKIYDAGDYWVGEYLTNYQGDRDKLYCIPKCHCATLKDAKIKLITSDGERYRIWSGENIW